VTAVGATESTEFRRQCQLLGSYWPHCLRASIVVPDSNHFTIVETLARRGSVLQEAVEDLFAQVS
jgi:hypothetical protein